jgi:hypothetical protein
MLFYKCKDDMIGVTSSEQKGAFFAKRAPFAHLAGRQIY